MRKSCGKQSVEAGIDASSPHCQIELVLHKFAKLNSLKEVFLVSSSEQAAVLKASNRHRSKTTNTR